MALRFQFVHGRSTRRQKPLTSSWLHLNQKDLKLGKKWLSRVNLPMGRCMTPLSIIQDVWHPLGLHYLNQKDLKSGEKQLSYGQFTNGRLCEWSEYHQGSIAASFEPKRFKIQPKMTELWPIYQKEICESSEYHVRRMGSIQFLFDLKRSKIGQEAVRLWHIY